MTVILRGTAFDSPFARETNLLVIIAVGLAVFHLFAGVAERAYHCVRREVGYTPADGNSNQVAVVNQKFKSARVVIIWHASASPGKISVLEEAISAHWDLFVTGRSLNL